MNANKLGNYANTSEMAVFQPDGNTSIPARIDRANNTIWISQNEIAELFGCTRANVSMHLSNAIKEDLKDESVCKDFLQTAADGKTYSVKCYNLDAVLSVGYRVKSPRGVQFRRWANGVIKSRMMRQPVSLMSSCEMNQITANVDNIIQLARAGIAGNVALERQQIDALLAQRTDRGRSEGQNRFRAFRR